MTTHIFDTPVDCPYCGETFLTERYLLKRGRVPYCSRRCSRKAHPPYRTPVAQRFQKFVVQGPECWGWIGATFHYGYGLIQGPDKNGKLRSLYAHRVAWEMASGEPIPQGLRVLHTCDNPPCTKNDEHGTYTVDGIEYERWGHLFLATDTVNGRDRDLKGRHGSILHPGSMPKGENHWMKKNPERIPRGENKPQAKWTDAEIAEIRERYAAGERQVDLCHSFGVSAPHMHNIVTGRYR